MNKTFIIFTTPSFEDCKKKNVGEVSIPYGPFQSVRLIYNRLYTDNDVQPVATLKKDSWWIAPDGKLYSDVNMVGPQVKSRKG